MIDSGAPRVKRASEAPWVNKSTHRRKFGNHVTDRPSAPQAYQCLLSHFLATLGAQKKAACTSMLSSITVLVVWLVHHFSRFQAASSAAARREITRFCNVLSRSPCLSRLLGTSAELSRTSIG